MSLTVYILCIVFMTLGLAGGFQLLVTWRRSGFWSKLQHVAGVLLCVLFFMIVFWLLRDGHV